MNSVSIVIPVYNEIRTLAEMLDHVRIAPTAGLKKEVIVVDDGSTDGSREYLQQLDENGVSCLFHERNQGKGAALRTGFARATGDVVLVQDADLEYDPEEYPKLLRPIIDGKADVVLSSRFLGDEAHRALYYWHAVGNKFITTLSNVFTNLNLTDIESCYKVFTRQVLTRIRIEENRFGFEPEIVAKVARLRCRVYEIGVSYAGRTYDDGKKITWKDGVRALWCIVKYSR
ncbi:MAG: glycosyl transferase [Candidatus Rokubacteria bacterium 13_1_40CM_69_27]|nr:MAG: glycosyl transferase [Candidatus Rokubacteria bacterium 13_1_40CM_69_27]OLC39668.1 MAG: glycosyl transferase [Candidatus Rokubacteria bacterium 13_1_40CM_4_69_5]OLE38864.1 MAG: glycosyl transferase [Candidatus Rokubacteria bacterium 13_1_20CM_2_70_7]